MAAETTIGISYDTRDDLDEIARRIRHQRGTDKRLDRDETVRELIAAWIDYHRETEDA